MATKQNVTNTIANTTITGNSFTKSGNYYSGTIYVKAADGYYFPELEAGNTKTSAQTPFRVTFVNGANEGVLTAFYYGGSNYTDVDGVRYYHTLRFQVFTSETNIDETTFNLPWKLYANAVQPISEPARTLTVSTTETHATISGLPQSVDVETNLQLTATAANGYEFNAAPYIEFDEMILDGGGNPLTVLNFTVSNDKLTASVSINLADCNLDYINQCTALNIVAVAAEIEPTPPPQTEIDLETSLQNATISGIPQTVYTDTVLNLTATAITDYEFNSAPYIYGIDANGNPISLPFTVAANKLTATITADLSLYALNSLSVLTVYASADAITPYVEKYGTINLYKVTTNDLAAFAAQRFFKEKLNASDTSGYFQLIDLGDFVVSVKRFYCAVNDTLSAVLKCGNYNTNIQVETPENDNLTVDCGTVAIPMHNNSNVDFDSEIKCFVPFVGYVSIPSDYCGKTIGLQYIVNLVNGDCVAKLTCNGIDIDFVQCSISNDIIYKTNKENNFVGNAEFNLQVLKGLQPFISVKYYTDANAQIYNADCVRVSLNSVIGYAQITELTNFAAANITETEKNTLIASLANGVIFENNS